MSIKPASVRTFSFIKIKYKKILDLNKILIKNLKMESHKSSANEILGKDGTNEDASQSPDTRLHNFCMRVCGRGRPLMEPIEGQETKGCQKLSTLFHIYFRPTRNPYCTRQLVYQHLLPGAKELIVGRRSNVDHGSEKCEWEYLIFLRVKDNTYERCYKLLQSDFVEIMKPLNQWPADIEEHKVNYSSNSFCLNSFFIFELFLARRRRLTSPICRAS